MPIPKPKAKETQKEFISRCVSNATMVKDYPDQKVRLGVCFTSWSKEKKEMDEVKEVAMESYGDIKIIVNDIMPADAELQMLTISDKLGIKALYSLTRKKILVYYFDPYQDYNWTTKKATEWYEGHKTTKPEVEAKRFFKVDEDQRIVYGVVLIPWEIDLQGDIMSDIEVEKAAHRFVESFQEVDEMHEISGVGTLLESYIAPLDFWMGGVKVVKGSWILVTRAEEAVWKKIKDGELVGYSVGYVGTRTPEEA